MKPAHERCGTCEFYVYHLDYMNCSIPHWMPLKNLIDINERVPEDWRVCGESMYAEHSIRYDELETFFYAFSIWDDDNYCLDWAEFLRWCELLNIEHVPVIYIGKFKYEILKTFMKI